MEGYRERRKPSDSDAWITVGPHSARVRLLNVSRHGMAVQNAPDAAQGALCRIEKGPLTLFGTVRWVEEDKVGVELAQPMSERDAEIFGANKG